MEGLFEMDNDILKVEVINLVNSVCGNVMTIEDVNKDLPVDSISYITLLVEIEEKYDICIPDEFLNMNCFRNIESICDIIMKVKAAS